ncbi:MAG: AI-2E family transporter [Cyclobacteriaceae bacterium]
MNLKLSQYATISIVLTTAIAGLIYFRGILQPLALALIVWYLIRAIRLAIGRIKIGKWHIPIMVQKVLAIVLGFSVLWGVFEIISLNVELILRSASQYEKNYNRLILGFTEFTGIVDLDAFLREQLVKVDLRLVASELLNSISSIVGNTALVLVYVIFLLIEEAFMPVKLEKLVARNANADRVKDIIERISSAVNKYFTVKTMVSMLTGILSYIVLLVLNVDFAILWAFLIFLFNYIPYVGSFVATLLPAFFAIFQFSAFLPFVWVFVSVEFVQILVGNYIEPRIMGKTLNISPLIVVISLSFWGSIWGVLGMILSVPITSVMVIVFAHFSQTRNLASILSEKGSIDSFFEH